MEWDLTAKEDFAHRLLHWVDRFRYPIIFSLVAAVVLSLVLAGVTHWISVREGRAQVALFEAHDNPQSLEKVVSDFSSSRAALFALVDLTAKDLSENNFDNCIHRSEQLYQKGGRLTYFKVFALQEKGVCQRAKGDNKAAAETFARAAKEPGNVSPLASRFEEVRSLALAKDPSAKKQFEDLLQTKNLPPELKNEIENDFIWQSLQKSF